jgi:Ca2+-binding RTX toxin-like protein
MAYITGTSFTLAHREELQYGLGTAVTATVGGTQFVYLSNNINQGRDIRVFSVALDGSLTFVADIPDTASTALNGAWEMEVFTIGDTSYLAAVSQVDDGLSVFALSDTGPYLEHVDTVFDSEDVQYELNGARYLSVHQIEGNTFLTVTSRSFFGTDGTYDQGVTAFRVAADGTLSFTSAYSTAEVEAYPGSGSKSGWPSETFEVNGSYYFVLGDPLGERFSIMSIDPVTGALEMEVLYAGLAWPRYPTYGQIAVHTANNVPYLFAPSDSEEILYVFTYQGGENVELVTSINLTIPGYTFQAEVAEVYEVGDKVIVAVGSRGNSEGVLLFDFDVTTETLTELQWLPGRSSGEPDAQWLRDMSLGSQFTIDGVPYVLITSDDDHALNVYAIGGGDDDLTGTMVADLIEGYGGNDSLTGLDGDDVIRGFDGNDSLYGNRGDDDMTGGDGDDYMEAGLGNDLVNGGNGNDVMLGFAGKDRMFGGTGNDTMKGGAGADLLKGEDGDDEMVGGVGNDTLAGQLGNDLMNGGDGNDLMEGHAGFDRMFGGAGNDIMDGGAGDDLLKGNEGDDVITGGTGNDTIAGQAGDDVLNGNEGDDVIEGGAGRDLINGGQGVNLLTGGSAIDTFVFDTRATTGGDFNRITDFTDGVDLLDLTAYAYADASAALSGATQVDADVNLTLSDGQVVWLDNFLLSDLDGSDLILQSLV